MPGFQESFLQGKKVVNHASIYPQLSASVKIKTATTLSTKREFLAQELFLVNLGIIYTDLQLAGTLLRTAETNRSNETQMGTVRTTQYGKETISLKTEFLAV